MESQQLIETMPPEIYRSTKRSVELGKWPDGEALQPGQDPVSGWHPDGGQGPAPDFRYRGEQHA